MARKFKLLRMSAAKYSKKANFEMQMYQYCLRKVVLCSFIVQTSSDHVRCSLFGVNREIHTVG